MSVASLIPLALFYSVMMAGSILYAIAVSVLYAYGVAAYQFLRHGRVSGMLLVTVFMATVKGLVAVSGHTGASFDVPVLETAGFGLMFMATMFWGEPLVVRIARDLVPHAADAIASHRTLIRTLSIVWTVVYLGSGATTFILLTTLPLPVYLGAHTLTGWFWTGSGVAVSVVLCRRTVSGLLGNVLARPDVPSPGLAGLAPAGA